MNSNESLPESVSVYYNTAMLNFAVFIGAASLVLVGALITLFGKSKWVYLSLTLPMSILVVSLVGYKKLYRHTRGAKNSIPYLYFDRSAVSLLGISIPWSFIESIEIMAIPTRSGSLKFLAVGIKENIKSLQIPPKQLEWLTQNNRRLGRRFGIDVSSFLSLGAISYLTIDAGKIDSLAAAYLYAAQNLERSRASQPMGS